MTNISQLDVHALINPGGFPCACGKLHRADTIQYLAIEPGASEKLPEALRELSIKKPFIVMGDNSKRVLGDRLLQRLDVCGVSYKALRLPARGKILPNEHYLEQMEQAFSPDCDFILGIGSGVINDLCKMLAHSHGLDCGIVATAPSMDGYASNSSAMELNGVKTTVYTVCPKLIICDTEIMRQAPMEMLSAGFGDMAAKLISIADWRIAHLVTGEYYCEEIAQLMLSAFSKVLDCAQGLLQGSEQAVRRMTEGLILSGIASSFAGVSRPASGMEHTVSHLLEMFALARGAEPSLHGLQVGVGTREALALYKRALNFPFSEESCQRAFESFDQARWEKDMREIFGLQAETLIEQAAQEERYGRQKTARRYKNALENIEEILRIISTVCAQAERLSSALDMMGISGPENIETLGYTDAELKNALRFSPHLRSRYIFTSFCMDMGISF